ncbi:DNA dC-_dU-editing enzyme APOBEC-3A-like isoform X2 [Myotis lucifugus]|uniref:DNA dC->dU-editing enzyme APOBEC-3A-like isoform X2 n=1 Tax=Myotis lucifugus TaxID=59463 RepID=UPI0006D74588|nr:DNA dC->dU-editing enzyme APOBEC-3A-like isoform X2 [Myotis lucifugus]
MENNPAPTGRNLINKATFRRNFRNKHKNQTYLCYEVEVWKDGKWTKVKKYQGFRRKLTYKEPRHKESCWLVDNNGRRRGPYAELSFLDLFQSWNLDRGRQYRLTWYMSWSPYPDCAQKLVEFLGENSHVTLRIFAADIHSLCSGYEDGLRKLRDARAQLAIMTRDELQYCWVTFVDNQGQPFRPWPNLVEHIKTKKQELKDILGNQGN